MRRTPKPRTYQGRVWKPEQELAPADLAVSVDMRGCITDPARRARAQREVLEYLQKYPEEREFQEKCLATLFGVGLEEVTF